jgi:chromosome segregation ATPase
MNQNLQIASEAGQQEETTAGTDPLQDARSLIDHLNSALLIEGDGTAFSAEDLPIAPEPLPQVHAFTSAIMRQTDQIQYLAEQINRLDSDTEVAKLRAVVVDLCGALTEVTLRMKQDTSEAAGKIELLMEAMTIIGDVPDNADSCTKDASLLFGAKAMVERLVSLERLSTEANAAVLVLEEGESRSQGKIRDLSAALIKLNESIESARNEFAGLQHRMGSADRALAQELASLAGNVETDRNEIAGLWQRIGSSDQALAHGLARLAGDIETGRGEIAGLQQRIGSSDQALTQGLARLAGDIETGRGEIAGLQQRIGSSDQALAQGLARLAGDIETDRSEIAGLQQRIGSADRALAQGLARLAEDLEEGRKDGSRLQQRVGSIDQALGQGLAVMNERAAALRDELSKTSERLASVEDSAALHGAFKDKIDALGYRLGELEQRATAEIRSWRMQESERNAALIGKIEVLEQKNHALGQGTEQMAVRLNAAEQTIATVVQRQKALSSVHDRVVRLLLANPDLQA